MSDRAYIPKIYGRRQDKPLKPRQARLMETLLPRLAMPDPAAGPIDLAALFPQAEAFEFEAGFGGGEHLAWHAARRPRTGFVGAEPFVNGVAKLLARIADEGLENVRIHHGDARPLMEALPDASLSRIYVLHPDPWPKRRHFKRRMISPWFFAEAARLLKGGGELRVASDIPDYVRWTLMHARGAPAFEWAAERARDWTERPDDWPQTRYEAKAVREGRAPAYLIFRRRRWALSRM
ncbi:tRNA (guanine(46)-N(7))-methyltransferase TrmB [Amphiplicatus metriothermophilus]|uniref:tRNA (guanine-N(7)-)-methyltransferase n=1 Tax=Amphiplicatus metriothermophilus TaxID=1519374 RepID=A0A239PKI4_9PROT|nr:tRNA (guanine(46)-N(7))-methyltransferase TrmB [Amphiplicatus metriothermophilus]MBB5517518.1 tRNA (guanine-N7-)-methyltransferase [Amphiplicatus metriothermophilus]SNT68147.1 tRNA (guanine-N7-)-methyltransferase [Amphiplicatus metriothermophilus]